MFFASLSTPSNSFNTSHITANEFHSLGWPKFILKAIKWGALKDIMKAETEPCKFVE